jgi:hypothetical protein
VPRPRQSSHPHLPQSLMYTRTTRRTDLWLSSASNTDGQTACACLWQPVRRTNFQTQNYLFIYWNLLWWFLTTFSRHAQIPCIVAGESWLSIYIHKYICFIQKGEWRNWNPAEVINQDRKLPSTSITDVVSRRRQISNSGNSHGIWWRETRHLVT